MIGYATTELGTWARDWKTGVLHRVLLLGRTPHSICGAAIIANAILYEPRTWFDKAGEQCAMCRRLCLTGSEMPS